MNVKTYNRIEDLDEIKGPAFILKHSNACPVSFSAKDEVDRFMQDSDIDFYMVVVQDQRDVSNEIEDKMQVKHESPQLLFVKEGKAQFVLNHGSITVENIRIRTRQQK